VRKDVSEIVDELVPDSQMKKVKAGFESRADLAGQIVELLSPLEGANDVMTVDGWLEGIVDEDPDAQQKCDKIRAMFGEVTRIVRDLDNVFNRMSDIANG